MITPYRPKDIRPYYPSVIDIETAPDGTVIGVGYAWSINGHRYYQKFDHWCDWLVFYEQLLKHYPKESQLKRIYAHNGAGFDWLSFIEWAYRNNKLDKMDYIFAGGYGIGVNITIGKHHIRLRDSYRLMPASLAKLCATFKSEYAKTKIDVLPHILKEHDELAFWSYLENDVMALQEVIYKFWSMIYDLAGSVGELPMTLPSLASRLWRMTLPGEMMVPWNKRLKALERRAYTGGRTECFRVGVTPIKVYDANSEYPAVMLSGEYPLSYRGGFVKTYEGHHGLYHIRYNQTGRTHKPVLRDESSNEFRYEGEGVYAQPEIERMLKEGGTVQVIDGYVFDDIGNPFRQFIMRWWTVRLAAITDGNDALAFVTKILMNSLYGKFGQREDGYTLKLLTNEEFDKLLDAGKKMKVVGAFTLVHESRHSENTFVSIAAYITANARLLLYNAMCAAEDSGATLWATDTDSVHISGGTVPTGTGLGQWKLEYEGNAVYLGKKLYALADKGVKAKGIGKNAEELTYENFVELAEGRVTEVNMVFTAFPTFREVLIQNKPSSVMVTRQRRVKPTVT